MSVTGAVLRHLRLLVTRLCALQMTEYNVPGGKLNRGMTVVHRYVAAVVGGGRRAFFAVWIIARCCAVCRS